MYILKDSLETIFREQMYFVCTNQQTYQEIFKENIPKKKKLSEEVCNIIPS